MTFLYLIIVASLWTAGSATRVTQGTHMKRNLCLDGYQFTEGILWDLLAPNVVICAAMCARQNSCMTFTFHGSTCKGYSIPVTSVSPSASSVSGARTFLRNDAALSYELSVQSPTGYQYTNPVQFPSNVNISSMSRLCFAVQCCNDAHVLLTSDPRSSNTSLYEVVIGGWDNSKSALRVVKQGSILKSKQHVPLSCNAYRSFYVSWDNKAGTVEVGTRQLSGGCPVRTPFLSYTNPQPFSVSHVFLSGYGSSVPLWKLHGCLG